MIHNLNNRVPLVISARFFFLICLVSVQIMYVLGDIDKKNYNITSRCIPHNHTHAEAEGAEYQDTRHAPHFLPTSGGIACWMQNWMRLLNISFPLVGTELTTCHVYSHTLVPLCSNLVDRSPDRIFRFSSADRIYNKEIHRIAAVAARMSRQEWRRTCSAGSGTSNEWVMKE